MTYKRKLKSWLKKSPSLVKLKQKVYSIVRSFFDGTRGTTKLNVLTNFPLYLPHSAGSYNDRARLTIKSINQIFPFLRLLANNINSGEIQLKNIENFDGSVDEKLSSTKLKVLLDHYGSDKANLHNYHHLYGTILRENASVENIFEIGLGTNNADVVSHMGQAGKPGASLRAFRDFCPNACIYGADIDKRILFSEERIKTFFVDQTESASFNPILDQIPKTFDLVIDDGLHSPNANIASLDFALKIVKKGGWVVIEDIGVDAKSLWCVVSALLVEKYKSHLFYANDALVFAVQRLH